MPYLTDLADAVRASGLTVVEVPGWKTRGHGPMFATKGVVCHWTGTAPTVRPADDYPTLGVVRDGRTSLPGPLCNLGLGRNGTVYVVAAGLAYHAGTGSWPEIGTNGNANLLGIEAEGFGTWTAAQLPAYPRLCAALSARYRFPVSRIIGHHEWAPGRKPDISTWPGGMAAFRAAAAVRLAAPTIPASEEDTVITRYVKAKGKPDIFCMDFSAATVAYRGPVDPAEWAAVQGAVTLAEIPAEHMKTLITYGKKAG